MYTFQSYLRKNAKFFFRGTDKFLWAHKPLLRGKYPKRPLRLVILEFGLRFYIMMSIYTYFRAICAKTANFSFVVLPNFNGPIYPFLGVNTPNAPYGALFSNLDLDFTL